ncbi:MAG: hypothetical protein J5I59_10750 [Saprospiraceae bacterium]|nr:hypothetical protein [Saprospiraceae bacterium]
MKVSLVKYMVTICLIIVGSRGIAQEAFKGYFDSGYFGMYFNGFPKNLEGILSSGYYINFGFEIDYRLKKNIVLSPGISFQYTNTKQLEDNNQILSIKANLPLVLYYIPFNLESKYFLNEDWSIGLRYSSKFLIYKSMLLMDGIEINGNAFIRPGDYSDRWQNELTLSVGYKYRDLELRLGAGYVLDRIMDTKKDSPLGRKYVDCFSAGIKISYVIFRK